MTVSRGYMIAGAVYLLVGIAIGMYMGGTGDRSLQPVHAHINLLGFVLMTLFGLTFRLIPRIGASVLARMQFWLHQAGALVLLVLLWLLMTGRIDEAAMFPLAPAAEVAVVASVALFLLNLLKNDT